MKSNLNKVGLTITEFMVALVLLGILAVYLNMRSRMMAQQARIKTIKAMASRLRSDVDAIYTTCLATGIESSGKHIVTVNGRQIEVFNGYPAASASGVKQLLLDADYKISGGQIKFEVINDPGYSHTVMFEHIDAANRRGCGVKYVYDPNTHASPEIEIEDNNCE